MNDASKNQATEAQAFEALRLAQVNSTKAKSALWSSAAYDAAQAEQFFNRGMFGYAHEWACESLRYSVGAFHPDYRKARGMA